MKIIRQYLYLFLLCVLLASCEDTNLLLMTDAASDAVNAITLSDDDVRKLARQAARDADSRQQVAPPGNPYDARLRRLVAAYAERDGRVFNFKVYLTKDINAFAMADGSIRVYRGLMDLLDDKELLFVIGHEMGHVVKDHSRKKVVLAYAAGAVKKGLASQENQVGQIAGSLVGAFAEQLINAQFSQHEERQADLYGAAFLKAAGHDISSAVSALDKLAALARQHTFLSSHPDPAARAKRLLQGENNEDDDQDSLLSSLVAYGKKVVVGLLNLLLALLNWLLSLL